MQNQELNSKISKICRHRKVVIVVYIRPTWLGLYQVCPVDFFMVSLISVLNLSILLFLHGRYQFFLAWYHFSTRIYLSSCFFEISSRFKLWETSRRHWMYLYVCRKRGSIDCTVGCTCGGCCWRVIRAGWMTRVTNIGFYSIVPPTSSLTYCSVWIFNKDNATGTNDWWWLALSRTILRL